MTQGTYTGNLNRLCMTSAIDGDVAFSTLLL